MDKIKKVLELCCQVSNETMSDVFFSYSPHIPQIDVRIHPNGWISSDDVVDKFKESNTILKFSEWEDEFIKIESFTIRLNQNYTDKRLNELISKLEDILCS